MTLLQFGTEVTVCMKVYVSISLPKYSNAEIMTERLALDQ